MITLPADSRFDSWRSCGADIPTARATALAVTPQPAGDEIVVTSRLAWPNGTVIRGTVDANGEPLSAFTFPQSLFAVYGTGEDGQTGKPGYSWGGGWCKAAPGAKVIIMDMGFECPDVAYAGHFNEPGFNPIHSNEPDSQLILINCWFYNCDSAVILGGRHSHAYNCVVTTKGTKRTGISAHYGIRPVGEDNVVEGDGQRMNFVQTCHHDLSVEVTRHCAMVRLGMVNGVLDYHCWSNDAQDDNNLQAFITGVNRGFTIGGNIKNKPWDGDGNTLHKITKTDGTKVSIPSALNAIVIPDSASEGGSPPPPPPGGNDMVIGDRVQATAPLVIRSGPSKASSKVGDQPTGAFGVVSENGVLDPASGFTYVKVDFDNGVDGYCGQDKLVKVSTPLPPSIEDRIKAKWTANPVQSLTQEEAEYVLL